MLHLTLSAGVSILREDFWAKFCKRFVLGKSRVILMGIVLAAGCGADGERTASPRQAPALQPSGSAAKPSSPPILGSANAAPANPAPAPVPAPTPAAATINPAPNTVPPPQPVPAG